MEKKDASSVKITKGKTLVWETRESLALHKHLRIAYFLVILYEEY